MEQEEPCGLLAMEPDLLSELQGSKTLGNVDSSWDIAQGYFLAC